MRSIRIDAEGLTLHALERAGGGPKVLLLHGWLDHAHSFDWVMERLPAEAHLLALDFRGHGQSSHIPAGAHYHFTDYLADTHAALMHLGGGAHLVGHSMGGAVALMYAAAAPARVRSLFLIDSLGPLGGKFPRLVDRLTAYVEDLGKPRRWRTYATLEEAVARVLEQNASLPLNVASHLTRHGVEQTDGGVRFAFDPMLRRSFGHAYDREQVHAVLAAVKAPVRVLLSSTGSAFLSEERNERLALLRNPEVLTLEGGHHIHLEQPEATAAAITQWLALHEG